MDWVRDLDPDEYAVIVEELLREQTPRGGDLEGE